MHQSEPAPDRRVSRLLNYVPSTGRELRELLKLPLDAGECLDVDRKRRLVGERVEDVGSCAQIGASEQPEELEV